MFALVPQQRNRLVFRVKRKRVVEHCERALLQNGGVAPLVLCKARSAHRGVDYQQFSAVRKKAVFKVFLGKRKREVADFAAVRGLGFGCGDNLVFKVFAYAKNTFFVKIYRCPVCVAKNKRSVVRSEFAAYFAKPVALCVRLPRKYYYIEFFRFFVHAESPKQFIKSARFYYGCGFLLYTVF